MNLLYQGYSSWSVIKIMLKWRKILVNVHYPPFNWNKNLNFRLLDACFNRRWLGYMISTRHKPIFKTNNWLWNQAITKIQITKIGIKQIMCCTDMFHVVFPTTGILLFIFSCYWIRKAQSSKTTTFSRLPIAIINASGCFPPLRAFSYNYS